MNLIQILGVCFTASSLCMLVYVSVSSRNAMKKLT